jgi:hypothetical protein
MKTVASTLMIALCGLPLPLTSAIYPIAAQADDAANQGAANQIDTQAKSHVEERGPAKKTGRDPVAAAFQLPSGTVLNKQQRGALEKLKEDNGPDLQQAFDAMAQAKTAADRNKAMQDIRDVKATIRSGLNDILSMNGTAAGTGQSANGYSANPGYGYGYVPYYAAQAAYYPGAGYPGNYGYWAYGPYRNGPPPYYYHGKSYGTVNKPVAATNSVAKPAAKHH